MKTIVIEVRDTFEVPDLFRSDLIHQQVDVHILREIALNIGSNAVLQVERSDVSPLTSQLAEMQESLKEAIKSRLQSEERHGELSRRLAIIQSEHLTQVNTLREESNAERVRIRESLTKHMDTEIVEKARREAEEKYRGVLLLERERHATERETLVARIEERHAAQMTSIEKRHHEYFAEQQRTLSQLRAEHEGLVVKLIARLETNSSRGGSGATTSAAALGRTFEQNVERHLREAFGARSGFHLEDVHTAGHCGDLIMIFDGLRILIELKSYDPKTRVPTKEIEKLARDLAEVQPRCDAAIMISACSEITGHYSCGPLEVSSTVACVPVLFINNFLSLGEPLVTLHMMRVFLSMVAINVDPHDEEIACDDQERIISECARRCTGYLTDLSRQSTDILRQVSIMKNTATKLRETVIGMIESEVARFNGIIQLMTHVKKADDAPVVTDSETELDLDRTVFADPTTMSEHIRGVATHISSTYAIGDHRQQCPTKDILTSIKTLLNCSDKTARDSLKVLFLESVIKHGSVVGISKKAPVATDQVTGEQ